MDSNSKCDWENSYGFGSRAFESSKKTQLVDWMIVDDGEIGGGSFHLFTEDDGGNGGASDGGRVASAKSSLSASTGSSVKDGKQASNLKCTTVEGFSGNFDKKMQARGTEAASLGSAEPFIGLKLGKRTYFENNGAGGNVETAGVPAMHTPSTASFKKTKSSRQYIHVPCCVVEGCNVDLSMAKEYHRKHRVCGSHSKCPKVIVGGLERRFCQQCSRFHNLSEFDEAKRSCRRRLSDHNARRRKPQQETMQFSSNRRSSPLYEERQQLSFVLNNCPRIHSRDSVDTTWDSTCNSKFTLTKEYPLKFTGEGAINELMHMPGVKLPHVIDIHGSKRSPICSQLDATPEYRHALSLLSYDNRGPCAPETMPAAVHESVTCVAQPMMHTIQEGGSLSLPDFWLAGHQSSSPRIQSLASNVNFQETQLHATPLEAELYSQIMN